jgi:hypothetical protein
MGNFLYATKEPEEKDAMMLSFSAYHVERIKKKYLRMEKDSKILQSQLDYATRKTNATQEDLSLQLKELQDEHANLQASLTDMSNLLHAKTLESSDLVKQLLTSSKLNEFAFRDKELLTIRLEAMEKQLQATQKNKQQAESLFIKEKAHWRKTVQSDSRVFFDNRDKHIAAFQLKYTQPSLPQSIQKMLIIQAFDYFETELHA